MTIIHTQYYAYLTYFHVLNYSLANELIEYFNTSRTFAQYLSVIDAI
jgi:hypothetical protein